MGSIRIPENSVPQEGSFERPIIASKFTKEQLAELVLTEHPEAHEILARQELVEVKYLNKDSQICLGQIIIDRELVHDIQALFDFLLTEKFPLQQIVPVQSENFLSDDEASMQANNSSAFNFRYIANTMRLSLHAFGFAIDLNPHDNPLQKDGVTLAPSGAIRDESNPATFTSEHQVVKWLEQRGWEWGGSWQEPYQDYHHFQKPLATEQYLQQLELELQTGLISEEDFTTRKQKAEANSAKND